MVVAYDGTDFSGFQIQAQGERTVQGSIERALHEITGETIRIEAASRTDAGVHARGQVISFDLATPIPVERVPAAMNGALPPDVVAKEASVVSPDFNPRFRAKKKLYRYWIYTGRIRPPFHRNYTVHYTKDLDLELMREAARYMVGRKDFAAFHCAGREVENTVRHVLKVDCGQGGKLVQISVVADGFLYKMVRTMVGTLTEVGRGRMKPREVGNIIESKDRTLAGPTAEPQGLFLVKIWFEDLKGKS